MTQIIMRRGLPLLALAILVPAAVADETSPAPREVVQLAPIATQNGVGLAAREGHAPSRGEIAFNALDGSAAVKCELPREADQLARYRVGVIARLKDGKQLEAMDIVTWKPATAEEATGQPVVERIAASPTHRFRGVERISIKPLWNESDEERLLLGFELTARPDTKGAAVAEARHEAKDARHDAKKEKAGDEAPAKDKEGAEEERHPSPVVLKLPTPLLAGNRYGVILQPVWKEDGKKLIGFDVTLAVATFPKAETTG